MIIKIKYMDGMEHILQAHPGEWYDLRAAERRCYRAGEKVEIPLGVAMELPEGYEAIIKPRSSTFRKRHLIFADSGVIDNVYRGDTDFWSSVWYAIGMGIVMKNDRIAQFRIQKVQHVIEFKEVEHLEGEDRGGFGSTGTN